MPWLLMGTLNRAMRPLNGLAPKAEMQLVPKLAYFKLAQVKHMVETALGVDGRLDIPSNGAGILTCGTILKTAENVWERVLSISLMGAYLCCPVVLPHMIQQGCGSIINVASTTGAHDACARAVAYVSSKGGVTLLSRAMAIDQARQGIRVNVICPGPTETPMLRKAVTPEKLEAFAKIFPMGRLGQPEEIANAALLLSSNEDSSITGLVGFVDGGQTAQV